MKNISKLILLLFCVNFSFAQQNKAGVAKAEIAVVLNKWHQAAAKAEFNNYFSHMTNDAVFMGTDATENWQLKDFKAFSKPYFDAGKAWSFTTLERNIYVSQNIAWFDELLDTQMKICRGSGVLVKVDGVWKIQHYVLSMTIPNEKVKDVIVVKEAIENKLIIKLKKK